MTILVSLPSNPPSPVSRSPPVRARSVARVAPAHQPPTAPLRPGPGSLSRQSSGVSSVSGVTPLKLQSLAIDLACCDDFAGEGDEVGDGWVAWWLPPCEVDGDVRGVGERVVGHSGVRGDAGGGGGSDSYGASGCGRGRPGVLGGGGVG